MIKKLLTIVAFCASFSAINAQTNLTVQPAKLSGKPTLIESPSTALNFNEKAASVSVGDTLWYFFNKTWYKNPAGSFYTFATTRTGTLVTHAGSRFQNSGNLTITGLEALLSKAVTTSTASSVRIILCNLSITGQPLLPGLDSVTVVLTATNTNGYTYGANFTTPKFVANDFAVVIRNISPLATDTVKAWMTNGLTTTFGEGMGHMRVAGTFTYMTGLFPSPVGNDFEMLVAPRVVFTGSALQSSPTASTYCTGTAYTFTNNSSYYLKHRQYNLNEFYRRWRPLTNTITAIPADSVFTWNFGDATGNFYTTTSMPNIAHTYVSAGSYTGTLTAKYQHQTDNGVKQQDASTFVKAVAVCSGIQSFSGIEAINVYPNPSTGLVNIANLPSDSNIEVVNMLGQSVYSTKANQGNFTADLSSLPSGSYFVKINSVNEKTKIVKLILN